MDKQILFTQNSESEHSEYFGKFLSALNYPAIIIDNDGEVLDCNSYLLDFYNSSRSELLNSNIFSFCKNHCISPPFETIAKALEGTHTITSNTVIKSDYEVTVSLQWSASQTSYDVYRNVILITGFDVTNFVNSSAQEKNIKNIILDHIPNHLIFWKDRNSVYLGCNKALALQVGLKSSEEIIGKTDYDLPTLKEQSDAYRADDKIVMETGISKLNIEEDQTLSDGIVRTLSTCKSPLFDDEGNVYGILAISSDITERKKIEKELLQALEKTKEAEIIKTKAEAATLISNTKAVAEEEMRKTVMVLVGDIVHDLRTPIATISTVIDILDDILPILLDIIDEAKDLGSKKIALLNKTELNYLTTRKPIISIKKSVSLIADFIKTSLRELANAQKEQSSILLKENLTKCSSRRIIENTINTYPFPDNITININISYEFYLMSNSILLMKILFNLIRNAIDQISLNGRGEITITTETAPEVNIIKIKDTAGGAHPEVADNFYKGYFTTKINGTGIGLAFCKNTMKNFGGDIIYNSVYGEYIEFILVFPKIEHL